MRPPSIRSAARRTPPPVRRMRGRPVWTARSGRSRETAPGSTSAARSPTSRVSCRTPTRGSPRA